jgi:hypothetical protein
MKRPTVASPPQTATPRPLAGRLDAPPESVAARDLRPILEDLDDLLAAVTLLDAR